MTKCSVKITTDFTQVAPARMQRKSIKTSEGAQKRLRKKVEEKQVGNKLRKRGGKRLRKKVGNKLGKG